MATTAHGITYPEDYTAKADVPEVLASIATTVESALVTQDSERAALQAQFTAAGPLGMIVAYGGQAAPSGWKICDGTAHGSSALTSLLGSANVPDLRGRFVVGAGGSYARGATGGAASVTLTGAQSGVASHSHSAQSSSDSSDHNHSGTTAAKTPTTTMSFVSGKEAGNELAGSELNYLTDGTGLGDGGLPLTATQSSHTHSFTTGGRSAYHQHTITVNNAGEEIADSAHENRPPYWALIYIMKVV